MAHSYWRSKNCNGRKNISGCYFLTGVRQFSKVSLFSDLNHLEDITMGRQFNDLAGITQVELERAFAPEIKELQAAEHGGGGPKSLNDRLHIAVWTASVR